MQDEQGKWIPELSDKGYEVFNDYHRFLLLEGCRKSTKTISAVNKIARHLWENDGAIVAIIGKTLRNIKSSGVWQDLTKLSCGIPQWVAAGIGFSFSQEPKMTGDTKMTFFKVRNMHGGESECQVHSMEHEQDVETKFKSTRFSMIYLPEGDQFKDRHTFDILEDQLRVLGIPYEQHQLMVDCNPPEEGEDHWLYEVFFRQMNPDGTPFADAYRDKFHRIHFQLHDNPFISADEKETLENKYRHDRNRYARLVEGKWERDHSVGHFAEFFIENIHVRGEAFHPDESQWQILVPTQSCFQLLTGWDPGDVNHACSIIAPRDLGTQMAFDVLDEIVILQQKVSLDDFTDLVLERMDFWETYMKETHGRDKIKWSHRADLSVERFRSGAKATDALIIYRASGGRISVRGVPKLPHSVAARISLVKRLLFDQRLFISAQCMDTIDMLRNLRKGRAKTELIKDRSPQKHIFDALTYALLEEIPEDIQRRQAPEVKATMVSVEI